MQVECRATDDLEHVGSGSLLLQRFRQIAGLTLHFVEQARILDRDASNSSASSARVALRWSFRNQRRWRFRALLPPARLILIVSDINMPRMSGLELLPNAKAFRPDVPIIMITAHGDADTKRRALENGAEALFTKPINSGTLRSEIDSRLVRAG